MRLILAHANDASARWLAGRWRDGSMLLTPAGLHRMCWRLELDTDGRPRVGLRREHGDELSVAAVVCRLSTVVGLELRHVHPADRDYAAAELTAFLHAWLDACPAPVVNRPVAGHLNGPAWHPHRWAEAAGEAGLRMRTATVGLEPPSLLSQSCGSPDHALASPLRPIGVTVVGDTWFGPVCTSVGRRVRELSRMVGTRLLAATLDGPGPDPALLGVSPWPDLQDEAIAKALDRELAAA